MRLAQITRKLDTKASIVIEILKQLGVDMNMATPNSKIPEEHLDELISQLKASSTELMGNSMEEVHESKIDYSFFEGEIDTEIETIKAPKVDLEGIKVVGKIELPEKKISEPTDVNDETQKIERKPRNKKPHQPKKSKRKNVLSYEEKLKQERDAYNKELERKRREEKQKKQNHYKKIAKEIQATPQKAKKKTKAQIKKEEMLQQKRIHEENKPNSLIGRFLYWLNH